MLPTREARAHCIWAVSTWPDTRGFSFWGLWRLCLELAQQTFNSNMDLELLHSVVEGRSLTEEQAEKAMRALLAGESTPVLTAAFLTALRVRGETIPELTGFARAMRAAALPLAIEDACRPILDTCGTGGNPTA